ncbi:hypothetical protein C2S51_036228 [Perilla frutescens var. frutescens]|nr:hypothetical protein C2S51_036228 [Perilla frutescens var. frutescens]
MAYAAVISLKRTFDRSNKRIDRSVIECWVFYPSPPQPYKEIEIEIDLFMKTVKILKEEYTRDFQIEDLETMELLDCIPSLVTAA